MNVSTRVKAILARADSVAVPYVARRSTIVQAVELARRGVAAAVKPEDRADAEQRLALLEALQANAR